MMSFMAKPPSPVVAAAPRPTIVFTLAEQDAYIKRLQEEARVRNKEHKQDLYQAHNGSGGGRGGRSCRGGPVAAVAAAVVEVVAAGHPTMHRQIGQSPKQQTLKKTTMHKHFA